jgi:hypothetical protein
MYYPCRERSRSARHRSRGPSRSKPSAPLMARSTATHAITFEWVKCCGPPRTSQIPWSGDSHTDARCSTSAHWRRQPSALGWDHINLTGNYTETAPISREKAIPAHRRVLAPYFFRFVSGPHLRSTPAPAFPLPRSIHVPCRCGTHTHTAIPGHCSGSPPE